MMTNPCGNCADRMPACWGSCERYQAWKAERDKVVTARYDEKKRRGMIAEVQYKSLNKRRRSK